MEFVVVRKGVEHRVLVDDEDWPYVSQFKWCLTKAGYVMRNGKMVKRVKAPSHYLHRDLMGCTPGDGMHVDHINHNTLDNRRENLLRTSPSGNAQNTGSHRDSKYSTHRGVSFNTRCGCWVANHMIDGKKWSGHFPTEAAAAAAVEARRLEVARG